MALGMAIDDRLSPAVQEQVARQGARSHGFEKARDSLADFGYDFNAKRVERQTERIGADRVTERDAVVEKYRNLTLMERCRGPEGISAPEVVSVGADGGRLQTTVASEKGTHWHQYMGADLRILKSHELTADPAPELPEIFRDPERMGKLVSGISHKIAGTEAPADPDEAQRNHALESRETDAILSETPSTKAPNARSRRINQPETISREVLASRKLSAPLFGVLMAAYAWSLGFFRAARKGFVGDGSSANWDIWDAHFKAYGFVPILDFIHALTYVYNAAMASRTTREGWAIYLQWITWVWQGRVQEVIEALEARQQELGQPLPEDSDTNPRKVVAKSLTYLQNQHTRMSYPEYRRQGLAITSCHIESTIKQLNYRVKGSEMFWTDDGAEALLQLSADLLSDSRPLDTYWDRRAARMTGYRVYANSKT
jgi:hypothetical protein